MDVSPPLDPKKVVTQKIVHSCSEDFRHEIRRHKTMVLRLDIQPLDAWGQSRYQGIDACGDSAKKMHLGDLRPTDLKQIYVQIQCQLCGNITEFM